jgi:hypothetical protein
MDLSEYVNTMSYACALQHMRRNIDTHDFGVIFKLRCEFWDYMCCHLSTQKWKHRSQFLMPQNTTEVQSFGFTKPQGLIIPKRFLVQEPNKVS